MYYHTFSHMFRHLLRHLQGELFVYAQDDNKAKQQLWAYTKDEAIDAEKMYEKADNKYKYFILYVHYDGALKA